jgi:spermidine/putrescine transport system ATP-binding protein
MLELQHLKKSFDGTPVIKDISLTVQDGEFLSLLGPSGCGKTTILRMIAGFVHPDSGHILLDSKKIDSLPPYKRQLNTLFQNYALFPHMNVYDNIAYGLRMHHVPEKEIRTRVEQMLTMFKLPSFAKRYPAEMSGGQRQRVAIARAVINHPPLLLLDEPLTALDAKLRVEMRFELRSIQQQLGITFIYVTHDQEEALVMSDRIVVMQNGAIEQAGIPKEIYYHPQTKFVSNFIGETNLFDSVIAGTDKKTLVLEAESGSSLAIQDESNSFKSKELVNVSIRPDKVLWSAEPVLGFNMPAIVKETIFSGAQTKVFAELPNGAEFKITRLSATKLPSSGEKIYLSWKPEDAVVMHSVSQEITHALDTVDLGKWVAENAVQ